jgi:hypothetical protein
MIRAIAVSAAATAGLLLAGSAIAQAGPGPTSGTPGTPSGNPYARPLELGENDSATMPPESERIGFGTRAAADQRAAERARRENGSAIPAKVSDILAQAAVSDTNGQPVGTIESVDADGAVIVTASGKVKVPLNAFGKNRKGLLIGMSKHDFEALVAKANESPTG